MMPGAMPQALPGAMPQTVPSNARYERYATQLTQRVQDMGKPSRVLNAADPVDNDVLVTGEAHRTSRQPCGCGCGLIAHGQFRAGHRLDMITPAGMVIDRALLIAIAVYDGLPQREQDAWLRAKSRIEPRRAS